MNQNILNTEVQKFISDNLGADISRIIFSKSPFAAVSSKELAIQIESKKRTEKKLPLWFNTPGIYFPVKLSIEQTSSEITANYKSELVSGDTLIDLTGGFGVDSYYFSKKFEKVFHCEQNAELSEIAKNNAKVLGADNIEFFQGDGIEKLLSQNQKYSCIYIDPSRRVESQKVFKLEDCEPNIPAHFNALLEKADTLLIKSSPLLDISSALKELKNVKEVHVVSVKNDCKELLFLVKKGFEEEPEIICSALTDTGVEKYTFTISEEKNYQISNYSKPLKYLYEPDVALLKAGCFKLISRDFGVLKLQQNTHIYTSTEKVNHFIGRTFKILKIWSYSDFGKLNSVKTANVISRNFPLQPAEIKKKHKIKDGGDDYLLFVNGPGEELLAVHCHRLV
ncbi:MAG: hypothetical protein ABI390_02095 [Daejeonella sp.]